MKKKTEILALFVLLMLFVSGAHASEYGCKVLLCLANPASNGGPTGVAECVEPIHRLYHDLAHGRPFPTCDMVDGNDGSCYARVVYDPYDPCPTDAPDIAQNGEYIVQGVLLEDGKFALEGEPILIGDDGGYSQARACVGSPQGQYTVQGFEGDGYTVNVYGKLVWQQWHFSARAIDIYIDNRFYQRVRW
ncbi:MAG: hypothetical protein RBR35_00400 [Salinivirgaceae bacterium]|nr:hypothetical protein [Salinivirgaceae bacterium]